MDRYYIGVDGGGTKTALLACDRDGNTVAEAMCGPLNYNFIGMEAALEDLRVGISALGLPKGSVAAVGIGDPSIDDTAESETAREFADRARELIGAPVLVRSDAYMTLYALTGGEGSGVLMISGTGAMAIGEDENGNTHVAGGWGRISGDEGGGYYIALSGIKAALRFSDGIVPETALLQAALDFYRCRSPRELTGVFYGGTEPDIAGFSKCVAECADNGDRVARDILLKAARYLADYTSVLVKRCNTARVGVYGSVLMKNRTVRSEFEKILRGRFENISIEEPKINAQRAAALYALNNS